MLLQIRLPSAKPSIFVTSSNCNYFFFFLMHFSFPLYLHLFFISSCGKFDLSLLLYFFCFPPSPEGDVLNSGNPVNTTISLLTSPDSRAWNRQCWGWQAEEFWLMLGSDGTGDSQWPKRAFPRAGAAACPSLPLILQHWPPYAALPPDKHLVSLESNISWLLVSF